MEESNKKSGRKILKYLLIILVVIVCEVAFWSVYIIMSEGSAVRVRSVSSNTKVVTDYNFHRGRAYQVTKCRTETFDSLDAADWAADRYRSDLNEKMSKYHGYAARVWEKGTTVRVYEAVDLRMMSEEHLKEMDLYKYRNASRRRVKALNK